ncbi:MAG: helix-turn-helix transcriptional regulator [Bacillota bacterium]
MQTYVVKDAIKFACEETGLTLSRIAKVSGFTTEELRNMKLGRTAATEEQIKKLESVLGLSLLSRAVSLDKHVRTNSERVIDRVYTFFEVITKFFRGKN